MVNIWFVVGFAIFSAIGQFLTIRTALNGRYDEIPDSLILVTSVLFLAWPVVYISALIINKKKGGETKK